MWLKLFKSLKYLFFILAYLPVILVVVLRYVFSLFTVIGFIIFSIVLILLLKYLLQVKGESSELTDIRLAKPRSIKYTAFIITYLIPFLTFIDTATLIALVITYFIIVYIYISTPLFSINPLLKIIFGYNIYVFRKAGEYSFLISKKLLNEIQNPISVKMLEAYLFIE